MTQGHRHVVFHIFFNYTLNETYTLILDPTPKYVVERGIGALLGGSSSVLNNFSVGREKEKPHLFIFISSLDYDLGRVKHALIKRVGEALVSERSEHGMKDQWPPFLFMIPFP